MDCRIVMLGIEVRVLRISAGDAVEVRVACGRAVTRRSGVILTIAAIIRANRWALVGGEVVVAWKAEGSSAPRPRKWVFFAAAS